MASSSMFIATNTEIMFYNNREKIVIMKYCSLLIRLGSLAGYSKVSFQERQW